MTAIARPVFLVDMDTPLADFDVYFHERAAAMGWQMEVAGYHEQTARYATEHLTDAVQRRLAREMIETEPWFRNLPVVEGAVEGLNALAEVAEVFICTKPMERNATCRDDKGAWLAEHFGEEWVKRLIITPDKSVINGATLIDDAPKPEWFERAPWKPVIFTAPYNGAGTAWGDLPHWTWADGVERLFEIVFG